MSGSLPGTRPGMHAAPASHETPPPALQEAVLAGAHRLVEALTTVGGPRDRDDWLVVVGGCQSLINTLTAVQDQAIAEVARRESVWGEDGTLEEVVHGVGRVVLDAADLTAPAIGATHHQAQRRVEQAVRLAAGSVPVEADARDVPQPSGLNRLHGAMAAGSIDAQRAGVIAFELEDAPADVADAVVTALAGHLDGDAPALRKRTRVLLSRISPDLLRRRAERARAATGLRRWVAEPGVDEWHGTFPSEDAATAWAAIDGLAHDLVADGSCTSIEQARGKALTDLVTGNATVEVQVVLTVPADATSAMIPGSTAVDVVTDAVPTVAVVTDAAPTDAVVTEPGMTGGGLSRAETVDRSTTSSDTPGQGRDHTDALVEVQGARPSEPLLVRRAWLRDHLTPSARSKRRRGGSRRSDPVFAPCDPLTGSRLDPDDSLATTAYRPGEKLTALVRSRDGRCRFPGCSVAARLCDLDHVRPWPTGPTSAANLICLCRRHHRIKQAAGWSVRLTHDGTATWTDPTGRLRTTVPLDGLHTLVLVDTTRYAVDDTTACGGNDGAFAIAASDATVASAGKDSAIAMAASDGTGTSASTHRASSSVARSLALGAALARGAGAAPDAEPPPSPWSALETHVALLLEHLPAHPRCTSAAQPPPASTRCRRRAPVHETPPF